MGEKAKERKNEKWGLLERKWQLCIENEQNRPSSGAERNMRKLWNKNGEKVIVKPLHLGKFICFI